MKIFGHRGARGLASENTLAAIEAGITAGADFIEIDVRTTKDGVPVLWHNAVRNNYKIADNPLHVLKRLFPELLTLEEAVRAINHRSFIKLDIKIGTSPDAIVILLKNLIRQGWQSNEFLLASFSQPILFALHQALPQFDTQVIESWSGMRATHRARQLHTPYVCMNQHFLWWGFIKSMAKKYKLSAYTLNDPAKASRWERYGLWGVDTDFPDRFTKA